MRGQQSGLLAEVSDNPDTCRTRSAKNKKAAQGGFP
jgi:hypothetical protein